MKGILYVVSPPIGNPDDITGRAVSTLKEVDGVICEETKEGKKLLHRLGIDKPLFPLNEHNEEKATAEILKEIQEGKRLALISDCGTPLLADPGRHLVAAVQSQGIPVTPIPGASALTAALSVCGIPLERFLFYGFLSPKKEERRRELANLKKVPYPIVLLDTPYRLLPLLEDIVRVLGPGQPAVLAYDLTLPTELILRDNVASILARCRERKLKGEFVLILFKETGDQFGTYSHGTGHKKAGIPY